MVPVTGPYRPLSLDTVEKETVFNLECLIKAIYESPPTAQFPHAFTEAESVYSAPVIQKRIVPTPDGKTRMIYSIAFDISPGHGFDAAGIWNHIRPMAPNLVLP